MPIFFFFVKLIKYVTIAIESAAWDESDLSLVVQQPLDRETLDNYWVVIRAEDRGSPKLSSTVSHFSHFLAFSFLILALGILLKFNYSTAEFL